MAKFFVGQRVVLVRGFDLITRAKHYGLTGHIVGFCNFPIGTPTFEGIALPFVGDVTIQWDGWVGRSTQNTNQIEPILPEGAQPSEFSFQELMGNLTTIQEV